LGRWVGGERQWSCYAKTGSRRRSRGVSFSRGGSGTTRSAALSVRAAGGPERSSSELASHKSCAQSAVAPSPRVSASSLMTMGQGRSNVWGNWGPPATTLASHGAPSRTQWVSLSRAATLRRGCVSLKASRSTRTPTTSPPVRPSSGAGPMCGSFYTCVRVVCPTMRPGRFGRLVRKRNGCVALDTGRCSVHSAFGSPSRPRW